MRILVVHSRYLSGSMSGENRVVDEEVELLRSVGHDVCMAEHSADGVSRGGLVGRTLTSRGVRDDVAALVRAQGIEIAHFHNLFPAVGPKAITSARMAGARVVMTLHNYRLMCLAGTFFRDGEVCESCLGRGRLPGVVHACYRGSRAQSAVLARGVAVARQSALRSVSRFLAVSAFVRAKHIEAGYPADRIGVKPNFVGERQARNGPGTYFLTLSRLTEEKNVGEIVDAWEDGLGRLRIVGDGPERQSLEERARGRDIVFEGQVGADRVEALVADARALVVPSRWYEGQPRSVVEAYASGVPVVASRIGGLGETILEGETGYAVNPGDLEGWRAAIGRLADDDTSVRLGAAARRLWSSEYCAERAVQHLEAAYESALASAPSQG